jgi:lipopolysaccharide export system protein LptA
MNNIYTRITLLRILVLMGCCLSSLALALPDDINQEIVIEAGPGEFDLNRGLHILHGSPENPVLITQGSLRITGLEVTLELVEGAIHKITAKGKPAHFQQQPELDQGIISASGEELILDYTAQFLTIDIAAEFIQEGNTLTGCHIDYDLEARRANIDTCNDNERLRMVIPGSTQ